MKRNLTFSKVLLIALMAILPLSFYAQSNHKKPVEKYWYLSLDGGFSINHGDLANYTGTVFGDWNNSKQYFLHNFNGQFGVGYQFNGVLGLNGKFGYGTLSGEKLYTEQDPQFLIPCVNNDTYYYQDLQLDHTKYFEGKLNLTFNLFNMFKYNPRRVVNLVPHIGIGGIYYKAGAIQQLNANDGSNVFDPAEKYDLTLTAPVGAELTFNVAPKLDIYVDYTYLFAHKDNLDQVRKAPTDEIQYVNDMYSQLNLGLRLKFNNPCDIEKMARDAKEITMRVNPDPLVEDENGKVCFDVIVTIPEEYFEKQAVMNLTPYLTYNGGQIDLDPITFVGEKVKGEGDFRVNYKEGGEFTKHYCTDYVPELENSELMGNPMFYVYEGTIYPTQDEIVKNAYFTQGGERKLADGVIAKPEPEPESEPEPEPEPEPAPQPDFIYYFAKDSSVIRNNDQNKAARATLKEMLNGECKNFRIEAWASPEGELDHNNGLADDRAAAAQKDIKAQMKKAKKDAKNYEFNAKGNGPDWDKFVELVQASNLADKDAIVNNINKSSDREQTIKEMIAIYPELENEILPLIRRAEVYIDK